MVGAGEALRKSSDGMSDVRQFLPSILKSLYDGHVAAIQRP